MTDPMSSGEGKHSGPDMVRLQLNSISSAVMGVM